ncbi:MAG: RNA 2',3'-cyclic phosphodiesterase [Patescibacteria group bacterium]
MTKRCFIAINLPNSVKNEMATLITNLKQTNPNRAIKYVDSLTGHLTLHFLGSITDRQIEQVKEILKANCFDCQSTKLISNKIGGFPNLVKPRIVFLACQELGQGILKNLQARLGTELKKIGLAVDHRPWQPHLTLARIKESEQFKIENVIVPKFEILVKSLELMESQLKPSGPEYKILQSFNLLNS